ncbi:hypothetical protein [Pedobacter antarcticus]|uniref:hypothetical protein n=1 Tax=Pedobacter antarcticus TaxID=34086 RepID=UPI001C40B78E|nr:hypothetical protein [Pedobacter antarcticus]
MMSAKNRLEEETVWLAQAQMAKLFGKGRTTITKHIKNIFEEAELKKKWYVGISDTPVRTVL